MRYVLLLFIFSLSLNISAQTYSEKIDALNEYVHFTNESIHGMLIVHRLLENYNQEINKYVDLESHVLNNFSNKDLPRDIFEDPDDWFYITSPREWAALIAKNKSLPSSIKSQLQKPMGRMLSSIKNINQLRYDIERLTKNDLSKRSEIVKVYQKLEEGVTYYQNFYVEQTRLESIILDYYRSIKNGVHPTRQKNTLRTFSMIYEVQKSILLHVRTKNEGSLSDMHTKLSRSIKDFQRTQEKNLSPKHSRQYKNILEQSRATLASIQKYEKGYVPSELAQYGKYYFYYNSDLINNFNRYGNGTVFEMNTVLEKMNVSSLIFSELPHYFKVIYPKKIDKIETLETKKKAPVTTNTSIVNAIPVELEGRNIRNTNKSITVDDKMMTAKIYDHMLQDGDIVSINFNGEWVVKDLLLKREPKILKLKLNEQGKNYFILHAENLGSRPPNTMALDYTYKGQKKQIILKSDLNTSELVEIEYNPID